VLNSKIRGESQPRSHRPAYGRIGHHRGSRPPRIRTTIAAKKPAPFVDLVKRHFKATEPNELWCGDLTYVHTGEGFLYLATVIDVFSRRVIGWPLPLTCGPNSSVTPCAWLWLTAAGRSQEWCSIPIVEPNMEPESTRIWLTSRCAPVDGTRG